MTISWKFWNMVIGLGVKWLMFRQTKKRGKKTTHQCVWLISTVARNSPRCSGRTRRPGWGLQVSSRKCPASYVEISWDFHSHGGRSRAGCLILENPNLKGMITGGSPSCGKPHVIHAWSQDPTQLAPWSAGATCAPNSTEIACGTSEDGEGSQKIVFPVGEGIRMDWISLHC